MIDGIDIESKGAKGGKDWINVSMSKRLALLMETDEGKFEMLNQGGRQAAIGSDDTICRRGKVAVAAIEEEESFLEMAFLTREGGAERSVRDLDEGRASFKLGFLLLATMLKMLTFSS